MSMHCLTCFCHASVPRRHVNHFQDVACCMVQRPAGVFLSCCLVSEDIFRCHLPHGNLAFFQEDGPFDAPLHGEHGRGTSKKAIKSPGG
jgi:hypothetical protein